MPARVFEQVLGSILTGEVVAGARLSSERELATRYDASRVAVREALAQLEAAHLISIRHGANAIVRPAREWSFAVLPSYLRNCIATGGTRELLETLFDTLQLRRNLLEGIAEPQNTRLHAGDLDGARARLAEAWTHRDDPHDFAVGDCEMIRELLHALRKRPLLWLFNSIADTFIELSSPATAALQVPDDYVRVHRRFFDALEQGRVADAQKMMRQYWSRQDRWFVGVMETLAPEQARARKRTAAPKQRPARATVSPRKTRKR